MLKNSNITQIDDIVEVVDDEVPTLNTGQAKVIKREVVNVVTINSFKSCHYYNAKVSTIDSSAVIATCNNCNSKMKISKYTTCTIANVILEDDQSKLHRVTIFHDILQLINAYTAQDTTTD